MSKYTCAYIECILRQFLVYHLSIVCVQVGDKAVRRFGSKEEEGGAGWLGAAASFLAKSFYW